MRLGIFGGTRGVGYETVTQALAQGHTVTVLARDPSALDKISDKSRLTIVKGSVFDRPAVDQVVKGQDVIINSLGNRGFSGPELTVCSEGTPVILDSMKAHQIKRVITVTSFGVGDSWKDTSYFSGFILGLFLGKVIRDKDVQEKLIQESGLDWITIRPGGLTNGPKTGIYRLAPGISGGRISRADVADAILKQLESNEFLHKSPTAAY